MENGDELLEDMEMEALQDMGLTEDEAARELDDFAVFNRLMKSEPAADVDEFYIGAIGFAQLGDPEYDAKARFEWAVIKNLVKNKFGMPPKGSYLQWTKNNHDFGVYRDLSFFCSPTNVAHCNYQDLLMKYDFGCQETECRNLWEMKKHNQEPSWLRSLENDNEIFKLLE